MVAQDSHTYFNRTVPVLDSMIAAKRVPAMIIVARIPAAAMPSSQRGLEYDAMSDSYSNWVDGSCCRRCRRNTASPSTDPERRATIRRHRAPRPPSPWPGIIRNATTSCVYSGTFVNQAWPPDQKRRGAHGNITIT